MNVLVTGGASSGKSAVAEQVACSFGGPLVYLATMDGAGAEAQRRIARHREMRAGKGFVTVECARNVAAAPIPGDPSATTVLVEDLGNLVANELFSPESSTAPHQVGVVVAADISALAERCANTVVVGNEVGLDGVRYDADTQNYIAQIGGAACGIAACFDVVIEVVCGQACIVKGELA